MFPMNAKCLWMALVVSLSIGCSSSTDGTDTNASGVAPDGTAADWSETPAEYFFVVDSLGTEGGFNLDGLVSDGSDAGGGCKHVDGEIGAPFNENGVDNQLGSILGQVGSSLDVEGSTSEAIADGDVLIGMHVMGVNSFMSDSQVEVEMLLMQTTDGEGPMLNGAGKLAPGQTFNIDPRSFQEGTMTPLATLTGTLVNGLMLISGNVIAIELPVSDGTPLELRIRKPKVGAVISETSLTMGNIGGQLDLDEVLTAAEVFEEELGSFGGALETILRAQADSDPDSSGTCQAISVGLNFSAVDAVKGEIGTVEE